MTIAQEIVYLKNQLALNQKQYGRCMVERDTISMQYLEQRNRELIDRLNRLEDNGRIIHSDSRGGYERAR